ncbi:TonB-dependent receptor [Eilatimonas milleporae]|nr:TonB-dependent receptor [Eilatimonas milleporae]
MFAAVAVSPRSAAQDGAGAVPVVETIIVTAQKRVQPIDEVPATLTVIDADMIEFAAGNDLRSVIERTPGAASIGLGFSGNNSVSLRGLGGLATFGPYDSAVSFTLDEQVIPLRSFDALLLDAETVEILKGPQGTLYGRSTIGGAINIVTREMTKDWQAEATAQGGEHGFLALGAAAGGALGERLLVRGAVRYTEFDGDVENTLTDADTNGAEIFAGRFSAKALFSDDASLKVTYQADREDLTPTADLLLSEPRFPISGQSGLSLASRDTDRITARFENDFGDIRLIAMAGFEDTSVGNDFDLTDSILAPVAFAVPVAFTTDPDNDRSVTTTDEETISAEIRVQSETEGPFHWLVGASYLDLTFDREVSRRSLIPSFNITEVSTNGNVTYGVFADISYDVSQRLTIGGGIRIARDEVDYEGVTTFFGPLAGTPDFSEDSNFDDEYLVGNVRAVYDFGDHSVFARYARGFASGGYGEFAANALVRQPIDPFEASTSDSFELGMRGQKGRFTYSIAAFYNDVADGQVYQFDATTFVNIAENLDFESYGIDIEASAFLAQWAVLDFGLGLQEAEFKNVPDTNLSGARSGNRVPLAPELTVSAALSGERTLSNSGPLERAFYTLSVQHVGDRASDPANSFELDAYTILDARLGITLGPADIYLFGSNLGDERALLYGQNFGTPANPIPTANINRGRVLGAGITTRF